MLAQRIATAAFGIPLIVALTFAGGALFTAVVAIVLAIAASEFYRACGLLRTMGAALGIALTAAAPFAADLGRGWPQGVLTAMVALPLLWPVLASRPTTALHNWGVVGGGALYYGWLGAHLVFLRELPDGRDWLFLGLLTVFATDTGSYLVGRAFGRHKMAPQISPKKTWEGGIAGYVTGVITVIALRAVFGLDAGTLETAGLALLLPLATILGDLAESALKRSLAVKDMGSVLPGHGGFADRLDSILFAIPVLYYWVRWVVV